MSFFRAVAVLVSGTIIGHGITAIALPVLSRLYSPDDFSVLATFTSITAICSVIACLRFDVAISIPDSERDAWDLLVLSILFAAVISCFALLLTFIATDAIKGLIKQRSLEKHFWLIPVGVFGLGTYNALQMWLVRHKAFHTIAKSRVIQSTGTAFLQIGSGIAGMGPLGLLFGYLFNAASACIYMTTTLLRRHELLPKDTTIRFARLKATFWKYDKFPRLSTFEALFNILAIQGPLLLIATQMGTNDAGHLLFGLSIIQAPIAILGGSIGQVFLSSAPAEYRAGTLTKTTKETLLKLAIHGAPLILLVGALSPFIFPYVFGAEWTRAGILVAWMTPWFLLQFLATPISMVLHVTGNQRLALWLQVCGFALRCGGTWLAIKFTAPTAAEVYATTGFFFYAIYLWIILLALKRTHPLGSIKKD